MNKAPVTPKDWPDAIESPIFDDCELDDAVLFGSPLPNIDDWFEAFVSGAAKLQLGTDLLFTGATTINANTVLLEGVVLDQPTTIEVSFHRLASVPEDHEIKASDFKNRERLAVWSKRGTGVHFVFSYATRAAFAQVTKGVPIDEDFLVRQTKRQLWRTVEQSLCDSKLDIALLFAGTRGLPLEQIRQIDPSWRTPEELKAAGLHSSYRASDDADGNFKLSFGSRKMLAEDLGLQELPE